MSYNKLLSFLRQNSCLIHITMPHTNKGVSSYVFNECKYLMYIVN